MAMRHEELAGFDATRCAALVRVGELTPLGRGGTFIRLAAQLERVCPWADRRLGVVGEGGAGHLGQDGRAPGAGAVAPFQDQRRRSFRGDRAPSVTGPWRPAGAGGRGVPAQDPQGCAG